MAIFLAFLSFELNYFFGYKRYLNYKEKDRETKFKVVKILNPVSEYEDMKI